MNTPVNFKAVGVRAERPSAAFDMYTLYYTTRTYTTESTSLVPRIALEEIGVPYDVVEVELQPTPPDWYLEFNPHGKIPSLEVNTSEVSTPVVVYPSAAILFYLAESHPESSLLPRTALERAICYRGMFDMAEMLQSAYMMFFYPRRFSTDERDADRVRSKAVEWLGEYWRRIEGNLTGNDYYAGRQFTICDIYLYVLARWYVDVHERISGEELEPFDRLRAAYADSAAVDSRPSVTRALTCDEISKITAAP